MTTIQDPVAEAQTRLEELQREQADVHERFRSTVETADALAGQIADVEEHQAQLREQAGRGADVRSALADARTRLADLRGERDDLSAIAAHLQVQLTELGLELQTAERALREAKGRALLPARQAHVDSLNELFDEAERVWALLADVDDEIRRAGVAVPPDLEHAAQELTDPAILFRGSDQPHQRINLPTLGERQYR